MHVLSQPGTDFTHPHPSPPPPPPEHTHTHTQGKGGLAFWPACHRMLTQCDKMWWLSLLSCTRSELQVTHRSLQRSALSRPAQLRQKCASETAQRP